MIYNLQILSEAKKLLNFIENLAGSETLLEVKKVYKNRSNLQNRYIHALFTIFGNEFGYTASESKIVVKRELGYCYEKNGKWFLKETSKMDKLEMTVFIEKFRAFSSEQGLYLLSPDEYFSKDWYKFENELNKVENQRI
jgi:hypothetical protein